MKALANLAQNLLYFRRTIKFNAINYIFEFNWGTNYNTQGTITKFCIRNYYFIDWNENELNPCFKRLLINMSLDKKEEGKIKVFHPKLLP